MPEKELAPAKEAHNIQFFQSTAETDFDIASLMRILVKNKLIVVYTSIIFTLFAIVYAQLITPIYRASISFTSPEITYIPEDIKMFLAKVRRNYDNINVTERIKVIQERNNLETESVQFQKPSSYYYRKFINRVLSYDHQRDVFLKLNFDKKFSEGTTGTVDTEKTILRVHRSISLQKGEQSENLFIEEPNLLTIEGTNPEIISEFLNALTNAAIKNIQDEERNSLKTMISSQKTLLQNAKKTIFLKESESQLKGLKVLTYALQIAKNLKLKGNNFHENNDRIMMMAESGKNVSLSARALEQSPWRKIPIWFLYGELALREEIKILQHKAKNKDTLYLSSPEITLLDSIDPSFINYQIVTIRQPSFPPLTPFTPNREKIFMIGLLLGIITGLLLAFLKNALESQGQEKEDSHRQENKSIS
jgi:LPS O-antigen subunit length determinant protein (WzzB/FepE family)